MKIILAPDKFKGTLTAVQVAEIEEKALRKAAKGPLEIVRIPLADGGDGTAETLTAAMHGTLCTASVHDPLGRVIPAKFGLAGKTAILEMATASGMALLEQNELNPMKTSTFGTGELISAALNAGAEEIIIGIGGSATIDGGCGMAEALGARFFDGSGKPLTNLCGEKLSQIARVDMEKLDPRIFRTSFRIASDVTNPLLGTNGSAAVFGPQKGATKEMLPLLEQGLANLRKFVFEEKLLAGDMPGDGAAGGLGFGLRAFCRAMPESGAKLAIRLTGLETQLQDADCLITGEGRTDSQTENGKLCLEVAKLCRSLNVPAILLSGFAEGNPGGLFCKVCSALENPKTPFDEIRRNAAENLSKAAEKLMYDLQSAKK